METTVNDRIRKQPKYWAITTVAILVTAFVLVQPLQTIKADVTTEVTQGDLQKCKLRVETVKTTGQGGQTILTGNTVPKWNLSDAIDMNTIKSGHIAKTVHAEKQIYECEISQGNIPVIVDVTIVGEIYQNLTTQKRISEQAEAITCIKTEFNGDLINCFNSEPSGSVVLAGCVEQNLDNPLEMNTVNKGNKVKTIKAEKEVFLCDLNNTAAFDPLKKVDLVVFTDIWENLSVLDLPTPGNPVQKKEVFDFTCVTIITTAKVEACDFGLSDQIFP